MVGSVCLKFRLNLNISNLDECISFTGNITERQVGEFIYIYFF